MRTFDCKGVFRFLLLTLVSLAPDAFGQEGPDRKVEIVSVNPQIVASGGTLSATGDVSNIGNQPSEPTLLRFYISSDVNISPSDRSFTAASISALEPNQLFRITSAGEISEPPGTYWIGACVEADAADINPENDCSDSLEIRVPDIDLVALPVTPSITTFPAGFTLTFSTAVDNRGSETADATNLRYKLSSNPLITTSDSDIFTVAVPGLDGGERWIDESQGSIDAVPGTYFLGACVDAVAGESSTTNNCSQGTQIELLDSSLPDLVIEESSANPASWQPGEFIDFFARVSNQGVAPSAATSVNFHISTNSTIDENDSVLGSASVPAINAGQSADTGIFIDPGLSPGTYWFGACVVTDGVEFDKDNNCSNGSPVTVNENSNTCANLPISCGGQVAGNLSSADCDDSPRGTGFYAKKHTFEGGAGEEVTISADFSADGYLYLENPSGSVVAENDDFSGVNNSLISYSLDATGTWTIWTTTAETATDMSFDLSLSCTAAPGPDLTATLTDVTPQSIVSGGALTLSATVSNEGSAPSDATTLRYIISTDAEITPIDPLLGIADVAGLAAGSSSMLSADFIGPVAAGSYWVGVCVDSVSGESSADNNCSAGTPLTVNANTNACIDTVIACGETLSDAINDTDCDDSPRGAGHFARAYSFAGSAGDTVTIEATWSGDGYLYLDDTSGQTVAENDNSDSSATSKIVHPLDTSGTWKIWATSSSPGQALSFDISLACESGVQPDLIVAAPEVSPLVVDFGDQISISTTVSNQGDGPSAVTNLRFVTSAVPDLSQGGTVWAVNSIGTLESGEQSPQSTFFAALFSPGTRWIGACVDEVPGEADASNNCSPAVQLTVRGGDGIPLNAGLNDSWYDPLTDGQGFFINVFPEVNKVFLSWFTYEIERPDETVTANLGEPGHRWLTATGDIDANRVVLDISMARGGIFNASPPKPVQNPDGQMTLEFVDCNTGVINYSIPSLELEGVVPIQRVSVENTPLCESMVQSMTASSVDTAADQKLKRVPVPNEDGEFRINPGLNDAWFYPLTDGQGFFINVFPDTQRLFLSWFTYDTERPDASVTAELGDPGHRWMTAIGPYSGTEAALDIYMTEGGIFDDSPPVPVRRIDGTMTVEFSDCNTGLVTFDIPSIDEQGTVPIERITLDNVPLCEMLSAETGTESTE